MTRRILISKNAVSFEARYLAQIDSIAEPSTSLGARQLFWRGVLPPDNGPNPNIRVALLDGTAVVLGYLALGFPETETIGRVREGLNIVINPRFQPCADAAPLLHAMGDLLCPSVPENYDIPSRSSTATI